VCLHVCMSEYGVFETMGAFAWLSNSFLICVVCYILVPFGIVTEGRDTIDSWYTGYGDMPPWGKVRGLLYSDRFIVLNLIRVMCYVVFHVIIGP
jgi:hypothetical protein